MTNPKRNQKLKLLLVGLTAVPLVWLSHGEYPGQPFSQVRDVIGSLVEVIVLVDALLKQDDSDPN